MQLDEGSIAHEGTLAALRQKHNAAIADMGEQIDVLNKAKAKCVHMLLSLPVTVSTYTNPFSAGPRRTATPWPRSWRRTRCCCSRTSRKSRTWRRTGR